MVTWFSDGQPSYNAMVDIDTNIFNHVSTLFTTKPLTEKLPESIESSRFFSCRARMSGEFDSTKDSQSTKFQRKPQMFVKLSFRELCN